MIKYKLQEYPAMKVCEQFCQEGCILAQIVEQQAKSGHKAEGAKTGEVGPLWPRRKWHQFTRTTLQTAEKECVRKDALRKEINATTREKKLRRELF